MSNKKFKMQGGVRNYLGKTEEVTAPRFWQSSPNSPKTELAYITDAEKGLLLEADLHGSLQDGKPNVGASGLLSFDGFGSRDPGQNRAGGDVSRDMDRGRDDSGSRSSGGGSTKAFQGNLSTKYNTAMSEQEQKKVVEKNVQDLVNKGVDPFAAKTGKTRTEKFVDDVSSYFKSGGLFGSVIRGISPFSKNLQKKAMTFNLNKKISDISNRPDFSPGAYGSKIQDIQKDLAAIEAGTFGQNDYTKKYGSGDATNPLDASFNPNALTDSERDNLTTLFASDIPLALTNAKPQNSVVNQYFKSINNANLGVSSAYMDTYNQAKDRMAKTLNLTPTNQQFGYDPNAFSNFSMSMTSSNPFFEELQNQGII